MPNRSEGSQESHGSGTPAPARVPLPVATALTLFVGMVGLATSEVARTLGARFPSWGYLAGEIAWNLTLLGELVWAVRRTDGKVTPSTLGLTRRTAAPSRSYPLVAAAVVAAIAGLAWWVAGSSATSGSSYSRVHHVGWALAAAEICVRYPLTAFAEESFFRGWLQPRQGRYGPVLSGVLWAGYHLQQAATIPSIVFFGLALGYLVWRTGSIRATIGLHYASDTAFFVLTYVT